MISQEVVELLNQQINKELFSAYFYLDISNYYNSKDLGGFGNWFYVQMQEERDHALLFNKYLLNNDEAVILADIKISEKKFSDFREPLIATLEHEKYVTALINEIYAKSYVNKDFRTMQFLDWFIKEQGEEEKNASDLIKKYELFGNDSKSLYLLDAELRTRVYAPATLII